MGRNPDKTPEYHVRNSTVGPEPQIPMTGRVARMHNITYIPMSENEMSAEGHYEYTEEYPSHPYRLYRTEPLSTTQEHFGTRGIRHYVDNPEEPTPSASAEKPILFADDYNDLWIHEGHHRIIASRLRGEPYIDVMRHENREDNDDPDWVHDESKDH
jgi:hypothetical protein